MMKKIISVLLVIGLMFGVYGQVIGTTSNIGKLNSYINEIWGTDVSSGYSIDSFGNIQVKHNNNPTRVVSGTYNVNNGLPTPYGVALFDDKLASINTYIKDMWGTDIDVDSVGNIYVVQNHHIKKIDKNKNISVFVGQNIAGFKDGIGADAQFNTISGITIDIDDNIYVADRKNNRIRKITKERQVTTLAGSGATGTTDGYVFDATFRQPINVAVDYIGNVYVVDSDYDGFGTKVRKISGNNVTTLVGSEKLGYKDGTTNKAEFSNIRWIVVDKNLNIFVSDGGRNKDGIGYASSIRKISLDGIVTTFMLGSGNQDGVNNIAYPSGTLMASVNKYNNAVGWGDYGKYNTTNNTVVMDKAGNIYMSDHNNHAIRKINQDRAIVTLAGHSVYDEQWQTIRPDRTRGYLDGYVNKALLNNPNTLTIHNNTIYFLDSGNNALRTLSLFSDDVLPPSTPNNLVASQITENSFRLDWKSSVDNFDIEGYEIYRNSNFVEKVTSTTYSFFNLNHSIVSNIQVLAYDKNGNKSGLSETLPVTTLSPPQDTQAPTVPTNLVSSNVTSNGFTVSWTPSTDNVGVTGYNVYRDGVYVVTVNKPSYIFVNLPTNKTYNITVLAFDASKNRSALSQPTTITLQRTPSSLQ